MDWWSKIISRLGDCLSDPQWLIYVYTWNGLNVCCILSDGWMNMVCVLSACHPCLPRDGHWSWRWLFWRVFRVVMHGSVMDALCHDLTSVWVHAWCGSGGNGVSGITGVEQNQNPSYKCIKWGLAKWALATLEINTCNEGGNCRGWAQVAQVAQETSKSEFRRTNSLLGK